MPDPKRYSINNDDARAVVGPGDDPGTARVRLYDNLKLGKRFEIELRSYDQVVVLKRVVDELEARWPWYKSSGRASDILLKSLKDSGALKESVYRLLRIAKMQKIGDLLSRTSRDLLRLANFGPAALRNVREVLYALGLHLEGDDWQPEGEEQ